MQEIPRDTITKASGGDIGAFEKIYRLASGYVYNIALRIAGNTQEAEEITQVYRIPTRGSKFSKSSVFPFYSNCRINCF